MPTKVAGRDLAVWSVQGAAALEGGGLTAADIASIETEVRTNGGDLDDFVMVVGGRADTSEDPPYFVFAFRFPIGANDILLPIVMGSAGFAGASDATDFVAKTIGGKDVSVGPLSLIHQDEHLQGQPYVYEKDDLLFLVITADEAWAADALRQLP